MADIAIMPPFALKARVTSPTSEKPLARWVLMAAAFVGVVSPTMRRIAVSIRTLPLQSGEELHVRRQRMQILMNLET